ncbi:hypothetical protein [Zoogloea sp.]
MTALPTLALILTIGLAFALAHRSASRPVQSIRIRRQPLHSTRAK